MTKQRFDHNTPHAIYTSHNGDKWFNPLARTIRIFGNENPRLMLTTKICRGV